MNGNGMNGEWTFLDRIAMLSFLIGVANYDENMTQNDKQDLQKDLANRTRKMLDEIHGHLAVQDAKLNIIMEALYENNRKAVKEDRV